MRYFIFLYLTTLIQYTQASDKVLPLYLEDGLLEIDLYFSFESLTNDVGKEPSYHDAWITLKEQEGPDSLKIKIKARGSFRKNPDNCDFPPLFIQKDDEKWSESVFAGDNKLKFVSHCRTADEEFDQYVVQEYLMYKAYSMFSLYHFKVRLAKITYHNTDNDSLIYERIGFFIEDKDDMAYRNDCRVIEVENLSARQVNQKEFKNLSFFQYMMMNNDWAVSLQHNIVLVIQSPSLIPVAVPYDFDWAGIINAPYDMPTAKNAPYLPERNYKGVCKKRKELKPVIQTFNDRRSDIYNLYHNYPYLTEENKQRIISTLDEFYVIINTRKYLRKNIIKACKF